MSEIRSPTLHSVTPQTWDQGGAIIFILIGLQGGGKSSSGHCGDGCIIVQVITAGGRGMHCDVIHYSLSRHTAALLHPAMYRNKEELWVLLSFYPKETQISDLRTFYSLICPDILSAISPAPILFSNQSLY